MSLQVQAYCYMQVRMMVFCLSDIAQSLTQLQSLQCIQ